MQGPEEEGRVQPAILKTLTTAEEAFLCFSSSRRGYIEKEELLSMMHEVGRRARCASSSMP